MAGAQYARLVVKRCPMHDEVCAQAVTARLTEIAVPGVDVTALIEEKCGRFTRGKHAGQLRGWAEITVVAEGGWHKDGPGYGHGHVVYPNTVQSIRIADFNGKPYLEMVR